ncbi:uncharacterized protein K02A2.6-like [Hyposmocoma kahamanoa]|uniref:uncharacterized protein K02A2.6-like n=1 Tax=Hyposmocoma kahamanoa TaxID=1477025 RepID=UPI000E6D7A82|nr:uncharacterized protein K02A2.6-like [Hyposmocoma kahamanoa]
MAGVHFGILTMFDHSVQTWQTYKSRVKQYFVANDIDAKEDPKGNKRRAILLSALAESIYKLVADLALPKAIEDVPYEGILSLLDEHFTPKRVGFAERHNFYAAVQQSGETHTQWAARLRGMSAHCNFKNIEETLRDKFIMGMQPGPEKEKIYAHDLTELPLAKAVELAENLRCARAAAATSSYTASAGVSTASGSELYKMSKKYKSFNSEKVNCATCGYTNHKTSECRFANYVCKKCNKKGHLKKMCTKVNFVYADGGDNGDDDDGKLFYIRSLRGEPMMETITINKLEYEFEIDSGSAVTVISESYYKTHFIDVPLSNTCKQLTTYNGKNIICIGTVRMPVSYVGITCDLDFYVVQDGGPPLLGRDFISLFKLQLTPVNYCQETDLLLNNFKEQYKDLFSDRLGTFNKYKIKLSIKDNSFPVFFKARPVAFALRDMVGKEIDRLVNLGILVPVEFSEYASPVVPVLKRNGTVRLCVDYSVSLNKQLLVEQYPLPTVNELFSKLHEGQQFSKLDLSMAYNQFVLDEESQKLTCINTHRGLFKYTRLVFGLASAPAIFQRAMECILSGMDGVLCLLDDVLVTGKDRTEHLERLHAVLKRLQGAGLTLQREKCEFFKDKVSYLGYVITKDGLKKSPEKIKAMVEAPLPTNINQLQSFLGLVNYYRNFVPNASTVLSPLYDLLKKGSKWNWTDEHNSAFIKVKELLASEQVLAHYKPSAKLILTVDASPSGLGAILSQVDSDGVERPIAFASRTLNVAEKRYAQIQKEATAIIYGVRRFHQYLYGRCKPFTLRTDHKPLISIFGPYKGIPEVSANRLQRYALFLSGYNYTIEYIRSADNSADFFSRASLPTPPTTAPDCIECACTEQCSDGEVEQTCDRASYVCFVFDNSAPVTLVKLREETKSDIVLNQVAKYIMNGWPQKNANMQLKPFYLCRSQLSYENGCIMRGHKVVVPESLYDKILKELHSSHLGIVKTKAEARSRVWFPGIDQALERLINSCEICIQLRPSPPRAPIAFWESPCNPFIRLHIDFLGPISGCTYLVVVDAHTKWVEVYNMHNSTGSSAVIEKICDFMSRFGVPKTLVSDNGTAFCSLEFNRFCESNGISHVTTPVYHPASNGQAESYVKVVKKGIKSCLLSCRTAKETKLKLLKYLMDYRNSIHSTTRYSPAQMVFGRKLRTRLDLINPKSSSFLSPSVTGNVKNKQYTHNNSVRKNKTKYFEKDNIVLYKKFVNKNNYKWVKGIIIKRLGTVMYLIKDYINLECVKRHKNQVVLYKGTSNNPLHYEKRSMYLPESSITPPQSRPQSPLQSPPTPSSPHSLLQVSPQFHSTPLIDRHGSTRGRRAEMYEPHTSTLMTLDGSENTMHPTRRSVDEKDAAEQGHLDSHAEYQDADNESIGQTETSRSSPVDEPMRLLRKRPTINYKKYF